MQPLWEEEEGEGGGEGQQQRPRTLKHNIEEEPVTDTLFTLVWLVAHVTLQHSHVKLQSLRTETITLESSV
jgi:hypothetical protein